MKLHYTFTIPDPLSEAVDLQTEGSGQLTHIICKGCVRGFQPTTILAFLDIIRPKNLSYLTHLDMTGLRMGDERFYFLLNGMRELNIDLHSLTMAQNNLTDTSLVLLTRADLWCPALQFLDLADNMLEDTGLVLLFAFLQSPSYWRMYAHTSENLHTLVLRGNRLSQCLRHQTLIAFFQDPRSLQRIDLRQNSIDGSLLRQFLVHIRLNTTLHTLLLRDWDVKEALFLWPKFTESFFEANRTLVQMTLPLYERLAICSLTNFRVRDNPGAFHAGFNDGLGDSPEATFFFHALIRNTTLFKPHLIDQFLFTGHPFYSMIMTVLLCNSQMATVQPFHLLLRIFSFFTPTTFPYTRYGQFAIKA